jgi:hypothetical protein
MAVTVLKDASGLLTWASIVGDFSLAESERIITARSVLSTGALGPKWGRYGAARLLLGQPSVSRLFLGHCRCREMKLPERGDYDSIALLRHEGVVSDLFLCSMELDRQCIRAN